MGNDHEGRAQHLSHAGHEDHRVDQACEDARLSAVSQDETFAAVLQAFMSRRPLLKGAMTSLVLAYASPLTRFSTVSPMAINMTSSSAGVTQCSPIP
jgi:hypothetical protein